MSMELIDKRKLIEKVKTFHKWCIHTDNFPMIPSKRDNVGYLADDVLFGIDNEPTVKAIPLEVVEQIRARIELEKIGYPPSADYYKAIMKVLGIIDEVIKEQNG